MAVRPINQSIFMLTITPTSQLPSPPHHIFPLLHIPSTMADAFSTKHADQAINALTKLGFSFYQAWRLSYVTTTDSFYGGKPLCWERVLASTTPGNVWGDTQPIPVLFMDPTPKTIPDPHGQLTIQPAAADLPASIASCDFLTASASPGDLFDFCATHDLEIMPVYSSPKEFALVHGITGDEEEGTPRYDAWLADYSAWCEARGYDRRVEPIQVTFSRGYFPGEKTHEEQLFGGAWSIWGDDWNDAPYPCNASDMYTSRWIYSHTIPPFDDKEIPEDLAVPIKKVDDKWITFGSTGLRMYEHNVRFHSGVFRFTDHDMPVIRFAVHQKDRLADETAKVLKDAIWWPLHEDPAARYPDY